MVLYSTCHAGTQASLICDAAMVQHASYKEGKEHMQDLTDWLLIHAWQWYTSASAGPYPTARELGDEPGSLGGTRKEYGEHPTRLGTHITSLTSLVMQGSAWPLRGNPKPWTPQFHAVPRFEIDQQPSVLPSLLVTCVHVQSLSHVQLFATLWTIACQASLSIGFLRQEYCVGVLSHVRLLATPWTVAPQIPLSMGFSRQEYWSGLPLPFPGDLPDPGIEPMSPALAGGFFTAGPPGKPPHPLHPQSKIPMSPPLHILK